MEFVLSATILFLSLAVTVTNVANAVGLSYLKSICCVELEPKKIATNEALRLWALGSRSSLKLNGRKQYTRPSNSQKQPKAQSLKPQGYRDQIKMKLG